MKLWKLLLTAIPFGLAICPLYADFTYEQTTRMTGGSLMGMMKMADTFAKSGHKSTDPVQTTVAVKGNRMLRKSADTITITDLDRETITHVNIAKRTYSVMTFAQMKQMMDEMSQRIQGAQAAQSNPSPNPQNVDVQYDVKVDDTGNTKSVNGVTAHEKILTMTMQGTDSQSGATGGINMTTDMWLAPDIPGYEEVRGFYKRMAEKMAWVPDVNPMAMSRPGMAQAMSRMVKESSKLGGIPVLEVTKMTGQMQGMPQNSPDAQQNSSQSGPPPTSISGALGGMLAGRMAKRRQDAANDPNASSGSLMETTMEMTNFSSAPADPGLFEVPAGFKQVEPDAMRPAGRGKK